METTDRRAQRLANVAGLSLLASIPLAAVNGDAAWSLLLVLAGLAAGAAYVSGRIP